MHLPAIITDLAIILLVAGITTLIFKKINQPLVLGYIIAGFLTGPNFQYFPTIKDSVNVSTWSEIGVIFLLFALGLEFSFDKLKKVGSTAFIGTSCEILGMLVFGYIAGKMLGWSNMNSVFLGGMLSMSSTTIIIKAFDDLNLRKEKFTEVVFGMLIVEDIAGIVMMVMLSTIAVAAANINGMQLLMCIGRLVFFLVLWFVCGIYLIPTFFRKFQKLMNKETLIVCTIGLCLGMAVLATKLGFSSALGAFIMGSLIAEAPNLHEIEELVNPIKDLFGAVFFVSVGMLVNPRLLAQYWLPILVIIFTTIIGKLIFSTGGVLLGGKSLRDSVHAGFSLAQIGEFSFIIAALGTSLQVTSDYLYPIVVAVSVTTTFTTPYFINFAEKGYLIIRGILPEKLLRALDKKDTGDRIDAQDSDWQKLFSSYITAFLICATLLTAIALGSQQYLVDFILTFMKPPYHLYLATALTIFFMAPLLKSLLTPGYMDTYTILWLKNTTNRIPLTILTGLNYLLVAGSVLFALNQVGKIPLIYALPITALCIYVIYKSTWLNSQYLNIKSHFLINLNEKHIAEYRKNNNISTGYYFGNELKAAFFSIPENSELANKTIAASNFRTSSGCNIVGIKRNNQTENIPHSDFILQEGDVLLVVGTNLQLRRLNAAIENKKLGLAPEGSPMTLAEFTQSSENSREQLYAYTLIIDNNSPYLYKTIRNSKIREKLKAEIIGLVRGSYTMVNIDPDRTLEEGDLLWLLGQQEMLKSLYKENLY